jgi:hypothetical protein
MRRRSNSLVSSRSEFIAVDAREKIVAKRLMSKLKEYFALRRVRTPTPDASENQTPDKCRMLEDAHKLLSRRHPALNVEEDLPRFRTCVGRPHTYIIAAGGAGSFGSPAFFRGI